MNYSSNMKDNKELALARSVVYNFVMAIFITLALAVLSIYAFGLKLDIVLSDSMSPEFYKDDIVVIRAFDDYKVGDIIEFKTGASKPVTHRIKSKTGSGANAVYVTQGDANSSEDQSNVNASQINGKVIGIFEDGNNVYKFVKSNYFLFIDIILGVWVLSTTLSAEMEMRKHNIAKAE